MGCKVGKTAQVVPHIEGERREASASGSGGEGEGVADSLTILHFNDVYNVQEREKEPVGGAARFKTKLASLRELEPLVMFSGDALNPSNISVITRGEHMVPVLNALGVDVAVYGNHDFDFGVEHLVELAQRMNFPWLMSNVHDKKTGKLLADGREKLVFTWKGRKIGVIGLVELDWFYTLSTIEPDEIAYTDYVTAAKELVPQLIEEGCELIVALTHMRVPNDTRLAEEVPEIHLILGGHDHHYELTRVGQVTMLKSGSDFREFSQITVRFSSSSSSKERESPVSESTRPTFEIEKHEITSNIEPDEELQSVVDEYMALVEEGMNEEMGSVECDLEGRFCEIRTRETNLGNFITDIMRRDTRSDIALLNSGTLRSDTVHESGVFKMRDLMAMLPMVDSLAVLELTGEQLLKALENGVSQYPSYEGRFPQVSGLSFTFDPSQPSGSRVISSTVLVKAEQLKLDRVYRLVTKGYIASGKDGYDVFKEAKVVVSEDEGPILSAIVRNHFSMCSKLQNGRSNDHVDGFNASTVRLLEADKGQINPQVEGRITIIGNS